MHCGENGNSEDKIDFEYVVLIRGSVHMSVLLCVHQKREAVCALPLPVTRQGSTPPLTNFVIDPLCFTGYTFGDVMSQLFILKGGGASDPKNPDLYYLYYYHFKNFRTTQLRIKS